MNVLIFLKESEKKKSQHFIAGQKLSQLHAKPFFNSSFCRRESRITLCQHETYFLCLSSSASKPKIINYSHSFGLLLFDCCWCFGAHSEMFLLVNLGFAVQDDRSERGQGGLSCLKAQPALGTVLYLCYPIPRFVVINIGQGLLFHRGTAFAVWWTDMDQCWLTLRMLLQAWGAGAPFSKGGPHRVQALQCCGASILEPPPLLAGRASSIRANVGMGKV